MKTVIVLSALLGVASLSAQSNGVRDVTASAAKTIVPITAKVRYSTMIVLPENLTFRPVAETIDIDMYVRRLRRQLPL